MTRQNRELKFNAQLHGHKLNVPDYSNKKKEVVEIDQKNLDAIERAQKKRFEELRKESNG